MSDLNIGVTLRPSTEKFGLPNQVRVEFKTTVKTLAEAFFNFDAATNGKNTRDPYDPGAEFWFDFASENAEVKTDRGWVNKAEVFPSVTFALNLDLGATIIVVKVAYGSPANPQWHFVEVTDGNEFKLIQPKLRVEPDGSLIGDGVYFPHDDELWPLPVLDRDDLEARGILNWLLCKRDSAPLRALIKSGQPYKGHALQILTAIERLQKALDEQ